MSNGEYKRPPMAGAELAEVVIMARMAVRFSASPSLYERAIVALADALLPVFVAGTTTANEQPKSEGDK